MNKVFNVHVRLADQIIAASEDEAFDKMLEALDDRDGFEIMGHDIMEEPRSASDVQADAGARSASAEAQRILDEQAKHVAAMLNNGWRAELDRQEKLVAEAVRLLTKITRAET